MSEDTRISMRKAVFVALLSIAATFQAVAQSAKQALDKTQEKAADDDVARAALVDLQQKYTESQTQLATVQQQLASFQSEEKVEDHPDIESQLSALGVDNGEVTTPAGAVGSPVARSVTCCRSAGPTELLF
jgi:uncharacterized protein YlxW (UPF0749 family)